MTEDYSSEGYLDGVIDMASSFVNTLRYLVKHMNMLFWWVSMGPYYLSWAYTNRVVLPGQKETWGWLIDNYGGDPTTAGMIRLILEWVAEWISASSTFFLGVIVVGPLLGGSTLLFNDYWDREYDKSIRKEEFPLVAGLLSPGVVMFSSIILMVMAIFVSLQISGLFTFFIAICLLLSILYSAPPFRLKERPGLDLLTCMIGAGVICSLAGWAAAGGGRPLGELVWWFVIVALGTGAVYMPTTIVDYEGDKKEGLTTIATRLGLQNSFYLGFICIALADVIIVLICYFEYLFTRGFLVWGIPIIAAQLIPYYLLARNPTPKNGVRAIILMGALLVIGNLAMAFNVAGIYFL
ncbi:MAG: UbiA prenyltransferase family protein [Halobacteriota archaeon]|nr:UbiA prenyltransferase family protein [Halobacteriota archaeon]